MNFLRRAVSSSISHPSRGSRQCVLLLRPVAQSSMYSTTYRLSNPQVRKPRQSSSPSPPPPPPPSSSSYTWGQKVRKQAESLTDWPRPSEIPYQAKVANSVNLIGQITTSVKFKTTPEGKSVAGAVISQGKDEPFVIPAVFEGDLAHVVSTHVKENDCVYVVGRLSEDPLPFVLGECQGKFHLVVENINFVEGFEKPSRRKNAASASTDGGRTYPKKNSEHKHDDSVDHSSMILESDAAIEPKTPQASLGKSAEAEEKWRDLLKNRSLWVDNRELKATGKYSRKYPDFKRKDGASLWMNSAPSWALPELANDGNYEQKVVMGKDTKREDSWKSLVENPNKWWDNRLGKKNPKAPDFKHKEKDEALWLNSAPSWVLPKLLEFKDNK